MTRRAGLVGYGMAGRGFHAPLLREAGMAVAAVVTRDPQRAAAARDELGAVVVPDLEALLDLGGLDVVVLASPSGVHAEQAVAALDAGLPVVVDKPLSVDAASAAALVERSQQRGVPLTVFQNRRYDPEFATLRRVLADGLVGDVVRCELRWERWRPTPARRWREESDWRSGGGLLLDLHPHLVDQAVQLFGPVHSVYAELEARTTVGEDVTFLALRHASGVSTHLGATTLSAAAGPRVRLLGTQAAYVLASAGDEESVLTDLASDAGHHGWLLRGPSWREPVPAGHADPADFYRAVRAALAAPDPQAAMPVDPSDAVHVLAVIDAARRSAAGDGLVAVRPPSAG